MTSATISSEIDRQRFAAVGRALADPKRLCVLESLAAGEVSVSDLSTRVGCQVPNMSQHLAVLRAAGLVTTRRDGSTVYYRLPGPPGLPGLPPPPPLAPHPAPHPPPPPP